MQLIGCSNAQNTVRGVAMLADAGDELLHNTFVVLMISAM